MSERKLVVLGIPWDVDTEGLREYMTKFGVLEDCIVMKERSTGRSRGFGYVTFATVEDSKAALASEHILGNRMLEVKVATPREEMRAPSKKVIRIFVARILPSVTEAEFRSHFEKYGDITDLYMPKDPTTRGHRGIGFVTFANSDAVDDLMTETHELGGLSVVVDRATPKEDEFRPNGRDFRPVGRTPHVGHSGHSEGGYGAYNAYISATTRYAALGAPTLYDYPGSIYDPRGELPCGSGNKIFVGRLPQEATTEDLRQYFGRFGRILDVYVPRVALIVFLSHIGSFVPAEAATVGLTDRIFCAMGSKFMTAEQSTFMIDLQQVAMMLRHASSLSLCLVDEFGKGTLSEDGIGLLGGIINYFASCDNPPKVMLSTHLSEIFENGYLLESNKINYYTMSVLSPDDKRTDVEDIVFLYRLVPGLAHLSYGLHCALLAGVPEEVIKRAASILFARVNNQNVDRLAHENIHAQDQQYMEAVEKMLAFDTSNGDLDLFFEDIFPSRPQAHSNSQLT